MSTGFSFVLSSNNGSSSSALDYSLNSNENMSNNNDFTSDNSILANPNMDDGGMDAFGGKDLFGDLSNMNESDLASFGDSANSVATAETAGSIASTSAETAGSVACAAGADSGSACSDGGFSSMC